MPLRRLGLGALGGSARARSRRRRLACCVAASGARGRPVARVGAAAGSPGEELMGCLVGWPTLGLVSWSHLGHVWFSVSWALARPKLASVRALAWLRKNGLTLRFFRARLGQAASSSSVGVTSRLSGSSSSSPALLHRRRPFFLCSGCRSVTMAP
jgi:hypothetical protein